MTDMVQIKKQDLVVKRIIDAPIDLVWKAWTQPEYMINWWGPQFYTSPFCKIDLREDGKFLFAMQAPEDQDGQVSYVSGVYKKIIPMQLLEFTQSLADEDGNKIDPTKIGMPIDFPEKIHTVVIFKAKGNMTELTITEYDWPVSQMYVYSFAGMHQSIDKLAEFLEKEIRRV